MKALKFLWKSPDQLEKWKILKFVIQVFSQLCCIFFTASVLSFLSFKFFFQINVNEFSQRFKEEKKWRKMWNLIKNDWNQTQKRLSEGEIFGVFVV